MTTETTHQTAIFTGATAGTGKANLTRLIAQQTSIKIYVVGRNAEKQQTFVHQLRNSNKNANIFFLEGEISLLAEVKRICDQIKAKESSIDAMFLSTGYIPHVRRESVSSHLLSSTADTDARQKQRKESTSSQHLRTTANSSSCCISCHFSKYHLTTLALSTLVAPATKSRTPYSTTSILRSLGITRCGT